MGSAGSQLQAAGRSGQRQTSRGELVRGAGSAEPQRELQIAVGSAGPQRGARERSGQRRTLTGSSRAEWAAPDLHRGASGQGGQRRTATARKKMPEGMSERMSENI